MICACGAFLLRRAGGGFACACPARQEAGVKTSATNGIGQVEPCEI
jgi:hypothetical protein